MDKNVFELKKPIFDKLIEFGFSLSGETYSYITRIYKGQFELRVEVSGSSGEVKTELIDRATDEPYTLHLVADASGAFVGSVRADYERVLTEISEKCFERDVFKSAGARKVIEYVRGKYGDELEYLWEKFPTNAVFRRKDNDKWYGAILVISKRKLGLKSDEVVDVIDLRIDPEVLPSVVDGKRYFAGYHMNKKNWFTICLDGSVDIAEVCEWLDKSYALASKKK
ncbi:MAG: hypothetical protein HDT28_08315 [Clostridiales bacterium]|nr:hypothetical protein [Clostridiales bacterium]